MERETSDSLVGGLYVHVPFCTRKCPYCSFYSITHSLNLEKRYIEYIRQDIDSKSRLYEEYPFFLNTFYVGGGTPSVLSLSAIKALVSMVKRNFCDKSDPLEATFELNPESSTEALFYLLKGLGFNRLSIGVQDLTAKGLKVLERPHTVQQAIKAIGRAQKVGFKEINIDLIFGWPGQSKGDLEETLEKLDSIKELVSHVSYYELTIEEGTRFHGTYGKAGLVEDQSDQMYEYTLIIEEQLSKMGFYQYEISNYARPGSFCQHNIGYWEARPYLGIGPGAVSFLPPKRWMNTHLGSKPGVLWEEELDTEKRFREAVVIGLRMNRGVSISGLKARFGLDPLSYYGKILKLLVDDGLALIDGDRLQLTRRGRMVSNQVLSNLV